MTSPWYTTRILGVYYYLRTCRFSFLCHGHRKPIFASLGVTYINENIMKYCKPYIRIILIEILECKTSKMRRKVVKIRSYLRAIMQLPWHSTYMFRIPNWRSYACLSPQKVHEMEICTLKCLNRLEILWF